MVDASNSNLQGVRIVLSPIFSLHASETSALLLAGNGTSAHGTSPDYFHVLPRQNLPQGSAQMYMTMGFTRSYPAVCHWGRQPPHKRQAKADHGAQPGCQDGVPQEVGLFPRGGTLAASTTVAFMSWALIGSLEIRSEATSPTALTSCSLLLASVSV